VIPDKAILVAGTNMDFAISQGFCERQAIEMFIEFRDYHVGKGSLMADWSAAWRTWVRNQIKFKGKPNGGSNGAHRQDASKIGFSGFAGRIRRNIEEKRTALQATFDIDACDIGSGDGHRNPPAGLERMAAIGYRERE
jgi:hypothetical protein